ncbi:MAG: tellurite resistance TerB family protein [Pseudomonadota bacterium]
MNLGDVVGQLLRDGISPQTKSRIEHAIGENGLGGANGPDIGSLFKNVLAGQSGQSGAGGIGDVLGNLGTMLGQDSGVGGLNKGQLGGIGALAGAILGGGGGAAKGALGGSAMALLGTLALSALRDWQENQSQQPASLSEDDVKQIAAPETAELCLRGMIEAIKSDGEISHDEVQRLVSELKEDNAGEDVKAFVEQEMNRPADVDRLINDVPNKEVGIQVYAAALMAISVDTDAERNFLGKLAEGVGLNANAVSRLHKLVGVS